VLKVTKVAMEDGPQTPLNTSRPAVLLLKVITNTLERTRNVRKAEETSKLMAIPAILDAQL
jgi:hypothetical protein